MDTILTLYIMIVTIILGTVMGSFINCLAWRIAHQEKVWQGRSHCVSCGHTLAPAELVPVLSYLIQRGRCRQCQEKISPRYMITELLTGAIFACTVWKMDVTWDALGTLILFCILLGLSLVDLEIYEIPDGFILAGMLLWILTLVLHPDTLVQDGIRGLLGGFLTGGALLVISLIFDRVLKKESLGGGDIKLFFLVGLFLGPAASLLNLIVACIIGIFMAVGLKKNKIPFGPAISLATCFSMLWGQQIIDWYLGLFL